MKTAFLFPGQGSQVVSMGADIAQAYPQAAEIFAKANDIVGFDLRKLCFEGPEEQLNTTTISQPAIFTTSAAILEVIRTNPSTADLKPDITAGLSLGEYTALYAADVISFEETLVLVQKRGQAMQAAADAAEGTMLSIIGLDEQKVKQLCDEARQEQILEAVNFNCPGQIVISGNIQACQRAEQLAPEYDAVKAVRLAVAGAFHTEMMSAAADDLAKAIENSKISEPADIKTIANINAEYYLDSQQIAQGLIKQLTSPLLWQKCMEKILADGTENLYEIGPSRVLTGLMRRINRQTPVSCINTQQAIEELVSSRELK